MKKKIYLHIGVHKTGSTAIQIYLSSLRENLKKDGFLYPNTGCPSYSPWGQHLLAWSLKEDEEDIPVFLGKKEVFTRQRTDELWGTLKNEIADSSLDNIVISSEELGTLTDSEINRFGNFMDDFTVVPIAYFRYFPELIDSIYRTSIIYGSYKHNLETYLGHTTIRLDLANMIKAWASICDSKNPPIFMSYDCSNSKDTLKRFINIIGIKNTALQTKLGTQINSQFPAFVCEFVKHMHASQVGSEYISEFVEKMRMTSFRDPPTHSYTLINPVAYGDLESVFRSEILKISSDEDLLKFIDDDIAEVMKILAKPNNTVFVEHLVDAMLAFGRELG